MSDHLYFELGYALVSFDINPYVQDAFIVICLVRVVLVVLVLEVLTYCFHRFVLFQITSSDMLKFTCAYLIR